MHSFEDQTQKYIDDLRSKTDAVCGNPEFDVLAWKTRMDKILVHGLRDEKNDMLVLESARLCTSDPCIQDFLELRPDLRDELDDKWEAVRDMLLPVY